jgi:type IX secretion system PorP/SprF family membrane protein
MKKIKFIFFLIAMADTCIGQDPHFSQYYASLSTVNPANTGFFTGDARITGLYRQQWPQYGSPFTSFTTSFEFKPGKYKYETTPDRMAMGVMLMSDKTPDGALKSQYAYLLFAYHKALDEKGINRIGVGIMGGYNQKSLDASQLTFADEFQSGGFQQGSTTDAVNSKTIGGFDLHAGILFSHEDEMKTFYVGGSVYHLTSPKNYFLEENAVLQTIPKRWNLNAGINIGGDYLRYAASFLYMNQANINEVMIGGAIGIPLPVNNGVLYGGSWYRYNEAIVPTINLQWETINVGLSYDVIATQKTIVKPRTVEISFSARLTKYRDFKTGCFAF